MSIFNIINRKADFFPTRVSSVFNIINATSNIFNVLNYLNKKDADVIDADAIIVDSLIIPKTVDLTKLNEIQIKIGFTKMYNIPFDIILADSNNYNIIDDDYHITIPKELVTISSTNSLLNDNFVIPMKSLQYMHVAINVLSKDDNLIDFNYQIIIKNIFVNDEERHKLINEEQNINIYVYSTVFTLNNDIYPTLPSNGLYIKTNSRLIDYELLLNKQLINKIPKCILNKFLQNSKDNEYLYYIPFNLLNNNLTNNTDGNIHLGRVDNMRVNIKTEDNINEGKLYIKSLNKITCVKGAGYLYSNEY